MPAYAAGAFERELGAIGMADDGGDESNIRTGDVLHSSLSHSPSFVPESGLSRRRFIRTAAVLGGAASLRLAAADEQPRELTAQPERALIAITLDLEMSRNFPTWETTHWDYEKGNLDEPTKRYCVAAARRVAAHGGVIHFFAVGRVLEQEDVGWLEEIARGGHPIGNHTYDHVNVLATRLEDVQFRFKRAPWLIAGREPADVIRENIQRTSLALKTRIGIDVAGFRTPGGFDPGLHGRPDVQQMLLGLGFKWVSCTSPKVNTGPSGAEPTPEVFAAIVKAQAAAQPFVYPSGLIDVPMSPISDVHAFRNMRWKLDSFLAAVRVGVQWAIEHRATFDLLSHPSVLQPMDPEFKVIELVCSLAKKAGKRAALVGLSALAERARSQLPPGSTR